MIQLSLRESNKVLIMIIAPPTEFSCWHDVVITNNSVGVARDAIIQQEGNCTNKPIRLYC